MGCYNYFLRKVLRFLTTKKGKFLLISFFVFIALFYLYCSCSTVKAVDSSITVDETFLTDNDVVRAYELVGETIWNDTDYDIYLVWAGSYWGSGSHLYNGDTSNLNLGKYVFYFDTTNCPSNMTEFRLYQGMSQGAQNGFVYRDGWYDSYTTAFPQTLKLLYWPDNNNTRTRTNAGFNVGSEVLNSDVLYFRPIRMRYNLVDTNGNLIYSPRTFPKITNDSSTINNWTFQNLLIHMNSIDVSYKKVYLNYTYTTPDDVVYDYQLELADNYTTSTEVTGSVVYEVPRYLLLPDVYINNGGELSFSLSLRGGGGFDETYDLSTYIFVLTSDEVVIINKIQDMDRQQSNNVIVDKSLLLQEELNEKMSSLENTFTSTGDIPDYIGPFGRYYA